MFDLHCHLLPGIDDGPESLQEALDLARAAVADGITHAVLTSHVHPERYPNQKRNLQTAVAEFDGHLKEAGIALNVRMGGEARLCPELIELIAEGEVPFLGETGGYKVLLLEFPHGMIPVGSLKFVQGLIRQRIRPLIAHPERNKAIMSDPQRVKEFTDAGCWLQITAGSLAGRFGDAAQTTAYQLVEEGYTALIATDAHNLHSRPPVISEGIRVLSERYGDRVAHTMSRTLPARILGVEAT